jgi:hypothetical protein
MGGLAPQLPDSGREVLRLPAAADRSREKRTELQVLRWPAALAPIHVEERDSPVW